MQRTVVIVGAAGRDFHNFNCVFRDNEDYKVVAFTAAQIPDIAGRKYPAELAGKLYPEGIPIVDEANLESIIREQNVDEVYFSYSDVRNQFVMDMAGRVLAAGANYGFVGSRPTMIKSTKPTVGVVAVRTGSGKSQTTRYLCDVLKDKGRKVAAVRHPMPYGDLAAQKVQRFGEYADLDKHNCTIEEREEYEPHIDNGEPCYAGVDYEAILREAEKEADVVFWDGGNNDMPFFKCDKLFVVCDPHRVGHESTYFPSSANVHLADVAVINKCNTAEPENIELLKKNILAINPKITIVECDSPVTIDKPELVKGKRVLVVEDGPTLTHGEMKYGAGVVAAKEHGAAELVDPRPFTVGTITDTYKKYPGIGTLLPAMGYGDQQVKDLEDTINATDCDVVVSATPIDITRLVKVNKPIVRVKYALAERKQGELAEILKEF